MVNVTRGALVEYSFTTPPQILLFDFNPQTMSRGRTATVKAGSLPAAYGNFTTPADTAVAAQGVTLQPESISMEILLDAVDRLNAGNPVAQVHGVRPELDTLYTMIEPKAQGPDGLQTLAGLGLDGARAFERHVYPSVILFVWGSNILPVFLTSINVRETAHFSSLVPYRAEVSIQMQVIAGDNPFYKVEKIRQLLNTALNTESTVGSGFGGLL